MTKLKHLLCGLLLVSSTLCHALTFHCTDDSWGGFVHYLYQNWDEIAGEQGKDFAFSDEEVPDLNRKLKLAARRSCPERDAFFFALAQLGDIERVDQVTQRLKNPARDFLSVQIKATYPIYLEKRNGIDTKAYPAEIDKLLHEHQAAIDDFFARLLAFYGTAAIPYDHFTIYLCPEVAPQQAPQTFVFGSSVHLFVSSHFHHHTAYEKTAYLGTVLHEIAHEVYQD